MKKRIPLLLILSFATLFLLSGCVNLVQDMTVREDGSGTVRVAFGVETASYEAVQEQIPDGFQLESLLSPLLQDDNVTDVSQEHYEADGSTWDAYVLEVADFAALFAEDQRMGPVTMALDEDEGVYSYEQVIYMAGSNLTIPGVNLLDLTGATYTVRLITPQITDTGGVQATAGTSTWDVSLSDLIEAGDEIILRAEYVLEPYEGRFIPWDIYFPYVMYGFLGLGLLVILVVVIVNTRKTGDDDGQKITFK